MKDVAKIAKSWHTRWGSSLPNWPKEGSFDLETLNQLAVLVPAYKSGELTKGGKVASSRQAKINRELALLGVCRKLAEKYHLAVEQQLKGAKAITNETTCKTDRLMNQATPEFST